VNKRSFFSILCFLLLWFIPKNSYIELNHLSLAYSIEIHCSNQITISYQEINPVKKDNTIQYQYKEYKVFGPSISDAFIHLKRKVPKTIYFGGLKHYRTNCDNKSIISHTDIPKHFIIR